jgi:transporter family-2 protein
VSKEVAVLATVTAGGLVAAQAPINDLLSKKTGTLGAVCVNFAAGTLIVLVITFVLAGGPGDREADAATSWYYWVFGGFAGVAIVLTTLISVRELGAGGVTAATIAGQLALSVVLDRLGVLGLPERAITWEKLLGVGLLALGTLLIVRD